MSWKTALLISLGRSWVLSWPSPLLAPSLLLYQQRAAQLWPESHEPGFCSLLCGLGHSTAPLWASTFPSPQREGIEMMDPLVFVLVAQLAPDVSGSLDETGLENSTECCHLHRWPWAIHRVDVDSRGRGRVQASDQQWPG